MNRKNSKEDDSNQKPTSSSNMKYGSNQKEYNEDELKSTSGPTTLLLWVWNWFATLYADFKSGELLSRFSFLDAMLQFIVAVATSCHPQEDGFSGESEEKSDSSTKEKEVKTFGGPGRTLRPRTVMTNS